MIILKDLSKKFSEKYIFKNLNAEFKNGLNFIIGPSGSGKTTFLRILSGIDKNYEGELIINSKNLKFFNEKELNRYYYNSIGFIWQDFKLIEHLTVAENVLLSLNLSEISEDLKKDKLILTLKKLGINHLYNKKVNKLSGGERQRVSIARAIIKNPDIIIADEPTSALDKNSSKKIINILKELSKTKLVIIVTHDKGLIDKNSNCFELNDGKLTQICTSKYIGEKISNKFITIPKLYLKNAFIMALNNIKGLILRFISITIILVISSCLLFINLNNTFSNKNEEIFNNLINERGNVLKDISIPTSAIGTFGLDTTNNKTSQEIEQDVSKVLEKYKNDTRIEGIFFDKKIDGMNVSIDGIIDNYKVENSNSPSVLNKIIKGRLPNLEGKEIAVNKKFLNNIGIKNDNAIGKKINIKGKIIDWSTGKPIEKDCSIDDAIIVGVIDSSIKYRYPNGKEIEYEPEDAFFYSLNIINTISGVKNDNKNVSFTLRVKNVKDLLLIVKEIQTMGITPLGEFEQVKDILSLNNVTNHQSVALTIIVGVLALIIMLIISIINAYLRKKEISILKINGYSKINIFKITLMEYSFIACISLIILLIIFIFINQIFYSTFIKNLLIQVLELITIITFQVLAMCGLTSYVYSHINIEKTLIGCKR